MAPHAQVGRLGGRSQGLPRRSLPSLGQLLFERLLLLLMIQRLGGRDVATAPVQHRLLLLLLL